MGGSSSTFSSSERSLSISATPDSESPAKENRQDLIKFNESVFTQNMPFQQPCTHSHKKFHFWWGPRRFNDYVSGHCYFWGSAGACFQNMIIAAYMRITFLQMASPKEIHQFAKYASPASGKLIDVPTPSYSLDNLNDTNLSVPSTSSNYQSASLSSSTWNLLFLGSLKFISFLYFLISDFYNLIKILIKAFSAQVSCQHQIHAEGDDQMVEWIVVKDEESHPQERENYPERADDQQAARSRNCPTMTKQLNYFYGAYKYFTNFN